MRTANFPVSQLDPASNGIYSGYNNVLSQYLGPVVAPPATNPHEKRYRNKWLLADAKEGRSYYLGETELDLLLTTNPHFMQDRFLPWWVPPDNNIRFSWSMIENNAHLMRNTPNLAPSRLMTQRKYTREASMLRKGISWEVENDFARTPEGRVSFIAYLRQAQLSVQETADLMGMQALMYASAEDDNYKKRNMKITDKTLREYFEQDRDNFAIVQKEINGVEKADGDINADLRKHGGYADAFIMDSEMKRYLEWRPHSTEYWLAGYRGPDMVNSAHPLASPVPKAFVNEAPVFMYEPRFVEGIGETDPLGRVRQTGSYNTMRDECEDYETYTTASRSRGCYDEDIDDWKTLTLYDSIEHCGLWTKEGNLRMIQGRIRDQDDLAALDRDPFIVTTSSPSDPDAKVVRRAITYLGDMDLQYLPTKTILNCAKTLTKALRKKMGDRDWKTFQDAVEALRPDADGMLKQTDVLRVATDPVRNAFKSILGSDGAFTDFAVNAENAFSEGVVLSVVMPKAVPVTNDPESQARPADFEGLKEVNARIKNVLLTMTPTSKKDEVEKILENPQNLPIPEVAEMVHQKLKLYVQDDTIKAKDKGSEFKKFKSPEHVTKVYSKRMSDYEAAKAKLQIPAKSSKPKVVGYMLPGQDLSNTPYRYLYSSSQTERSEIAAVIPFVHKMLDRATDKGDATGAPRRGYEDRGQGMGFSGIGRVAGFDRGAELKRRRGDASGVTKLVNQYRMIGHHVVELQKVGPSALEGMMAVAVLGLRFNKQNLLRLAHHDVCVPIDFILARPHQQRHTKAIIKAATGGKTGFTAVTIPDVMRSASAGSKYQHYHLTIWMRPVVTNPQNVYIMRDAMAVGYYGGNGTKFYSPESYPKVNWDDIENSIICLAIPVTETQIGNKHGTMDLTGRFGAEYILRESDQIDLSNMGSEGPHYSTFFRYNKLYNFDAQARRGAAHPNFAATKRHLNRVCEPAGQRKRGYNGQWLPPSVNRDHFGDIIGPGAAEVRRGKKKYVMGMTFR